MKDVTLELHIVPSRVNTTLIEGCDVCNIGKTCSTKDKIMVNKVGTDEYTILYFGDVFKGMNIPSLGSNIVNVLQANLKESNIKISIIYHYEFINDDDNDAFSLDVAMKIASLHMYFDKHYKNIPAINNNMIQYICSDSIIETAERIKDELSDEDDEDEDEENEDTDDEEEDEDEDDEEAETELSKILGGYGDKDKKKGDKKKKDYGRSRVFRVAKNPKRSYRRHGVLVCSKKSALKKDEKVIKEFLKDFFPGNAEWKKEFRKDVLKRWMSMYVVTSNKLKQLEKEHHKRMKKKKRYKSSINADKAVDLTRRLLNVPIDTWSDPSK